MFYKKFPDQVDVLKGLVVGRVFVFSVNILVPGELGVGIFSVARSSHHEDHQLDQKVNGVGQMGHVLSCDFGLIGHLVIR